MKKLENDKFIVVNRAHLRETVPPHLVERLFTTLHAINYYLPVRHQYIVINKDESYAGIIENIIVQHTHSDSDDCLYCKGSS